MSDIISSGAFATPVQPPIRELRYGCSYGGRIGAGRGGCCLCRYFVAQDKWATGYRYFPFSIAKLIYCKMFILFIIKLACWSIRVAATPQKPLASLWQGAMDVWLSF